MGQPIDNNIFCFLRPVFIFAGYFPGLSVRRSNCIYQFLLSQDSFLFFSRLFFIFADDKLLLHFLVFVHIESISGYVQFLGAQLHFKYVCLNNGLVSRLAGTFLVSILADIFCSVFFSF